MHFNNFYFYSFFTYVFFFILKKAVQNLVKQIIFAIYSVTVNATGYIKYFYSFLRYGVETKRGVEFRHALPPGFVGKWGTECLNTRLPLPTLLNAEYNLNEADKNINY